MLFPIYITDEDTPRQAGLMFAVKTGKPEGRFGAFIGRDEVLASAEKPLTRRLVQFRLLDPEPLLYHNEPILRDGEPVGYLTSGNYGHHIGGAVGLGYVNIPGDEGLGFVEDGTYEIDVAGDRFPAQASLMGARNGNLRRVGLGCGLGRLSVYFHTLSLRQPFASESGDVVPCSEPRRNSHARCGMWTRSRSLPLLTSRWCRAPRNGSSTCSY